MPWIPSIRRNEKAPPYAEWHNNTLRAKIRIPEWLRFHYPSDDTPTQFKEFLYENLNTDDCGKAKPLAAEFARHKKRGFDRIARLNGALLGLLSEANRWRKNIASADIPSASQKSLKSSPPIDAFELAQIGIEQCHSEYDSLVDRMYDLEELLGHARAMRFYNLVVGRTEPFSVGLDEWLKSEDYSATVAQRYRKLVLELIDWCKSNRIKPCIEAINTGRTRRFLSRRGVRSEKTVSNEKAALSSFWDWSNDRLKVELQSRLNGFEDWIGDSGHNPWRKDGAQKSSNSKRPSRK